MTASKRALPAVLCLVLLSGCAGTMVSRSDAPSPYADSRRGSMFGGYPFQAVVVDYRIEQDNLNEGNSYIVLGSLAVDTVVDLVLCPIDLVAWAFGYHKRAMRQ
jgi:hypothetical protein